MRDEDVIREKRQAFDNEFWRDIDRNGWSCPVNEEDRDEEN